MDNAKLKIAVIGANNRGGLARNINQFCSKDAEIVAGVDISEELRNCFQNDFERLFGYRPLAFASCQELYDHVKVDAVMVTTPDYLHEEHACFFLERGIPVYLEKPLSISIAGAQNIMRAAIKGHAKLMLGHNMRYMRFVLKMRELAQSGAIGNIKAVWCRHFVAYGGDAYFRDWHAEFDKCGTLLLQKGAHDIDVIDFITGSRPEVVQGIGALTLYDKLNRRAEAGVKTVDQVRFNETHWPPRAVRDLNPIIEVEDINMIQMRLRNGVLASYQQCFFTPDAWRNYTVIGDAGRIENFGYYTGKSEVRLWNTRHDRYCPEPDEAFDVSPTGDNHGGADDLICQGFVDMLLGRSKPHSTVQGAYYSIATGIAGAESIRSGGGLRNIVDLPEELENHDYSI